MKKILSLLFLVPLMAISQTVPADATALENIQITNNTTSLTATKVNVQDANGVINTISKSDLVNVVEVNDVPSLPLVGEVGKIYVVKNVNKIYRWNGTFYQGLAVTDITYQSIIDALNYVPANDVDVVHKTGAETIAGLKSFNDVVNMTKDATSISPSLADFSFLANRTILSSRVSNAYGFYDANVFSKNYGNASYSSYSANTELGGVNSINHYNAFQSRGNWSSTGTIIDYRGFVDDNFISASSGVITNKISFHSSGGTNSGTITNWYGLKIDNPPSGGSVTNFYPIYVQGGDSFLGDSVSLLQDYVSKNGGFFRSYLQAASNEFETSLGTNGATGVGILTLGNRGTNEIRLGRNLTGGSLDVYVNNTVGPLSSSDGTKAFSITNTGTIKFNQLEPQSGNLVLGFTSSIVYLGANASVNSTGTITASPATVDTQLATLGQAKAILNNATLTGTPTAPTAAAGTNTTQIATTAFVQANARPYKVYTALLSQSGTDAPTAVVLENTLGGTVVWARSTTGVYYATSGYRFTDNKTTVFINNHRQDSNVTIECTNNNNVSVSTYGTSAVPFSGVDGRLLNNAIEIRVYPSLE